MQTLNFCMGLDTISAEDKQNLPKPIHLSPTAYHVVEQSMSLSRLMHHVDFLEGQCKNP
jgi:hypothetical protein